MQNIPNINNSPDIRRYFLEVLPKIERTSPVIPIKEVIPMVIQRQVDESWIIGCYQSGDREFQMAATMWAKRKRAGNFLPSTVWMQ